MKRKSIDHQITRIQKVFGGERITSVRGSSNSNEKEYCVNLLVVDQIIVPTRDLFNAINLGCKKHNSWFLDLVHAYDLVEPISSVSYTLDNVNITNTISKKSFLPWKKGETAGRHIGLVENTFRCFNTERPLTFHEVVSLAFQYPGIFNEKIHGIQAYGSRFTKDPDSLSPGTDDTLEIYRKGNVGKGFLKLAREQYRYNEDSKIIPFVEM